MKQIVTISLVACIALTAACNNSASNQHPSTKYEEKKTSLEEMEQESPLKFLKVSGSHRSNLVNQVVIEGEVTNKATLVTYRDIQVQITFLDKEGGVIERQKHMLDDAVDPKSTYEFKIKTGHVKGAHSVSLDITKAIADK